MTKHMRILVEDLEMDRERWIVSRNGQLIKLTRREFALLEALMLASPRPVSKTWIIENVWRRRLSPSTNVVNVIINHLRNKLNLPGLPSLVHTVRRYGFVLRKEEKMKTLEPRSSQRDQTRK